MAVTVIERPHDFSFSENEIRYVFNVSNPTEPGCAVEVQLFYGKADIMVNSNKLITFQLVPDNDGRIYCHVGDYLKSILKHQLPDVNGAIVQPVPDQSRYFFIKYRQITTADSNDAFTTLLPLKVIILGGVEKMKFKRNNFFVSYLTNTKAFLTWQKSKYVYIDQPHYLTFLNAPYKASFNVNVRTVFTDNTVDTSKTVAVTASLDVVFRINAKAKAWDLDLINPAKQIYYYEISVTDADGIYLALPHRFYIEYNAVYEFWDLNYFNSISGIDFVRVKGETSISVDVPGEQQEHIIYKDAYNTDKPQHQFSSTNMVKTDNYKGDAGYLNFKGEQEALIELLLSSGIFEIVDGRWIKCLNLKKSQDLRTSTEKKWNFPVEWGYGYDDRVFTPKAIMLGDGTPDAIAGPACVGVEIPVGITLPDGVVGTPYDFSYDITTGTAPFYTSNENKPDWMKISINGNRVSHTGTPDVEATDINVSYTINNCSNNTADFADTIDVTAAVVVTPGGGGTGANPTMVIGVEHFGFFESPSGSQTYGIRVSIISPSGVTSNDDIVVKGILYQDNDTSNSTTWEVRLPAGYTTADSYQLLSIPIAFYPMISSITATPATIAGSDGITYDVVA